MNIRNRLSRIVPPFVVAFAVLTSLAACGSGPLVESGGYSVSQQWFADDEAVIRSKAAFAFSCPVEQIKFVVLSVSPDQPTAPSQIGVSGCGHRGIFVIDDGKWVLTGTVNDATASTGS